MRKKFTLLELMIVIAIIAILITMLIPSLNAARQKGLSAVCMSNLRQTAVINQIYMKDHDSAFPVSIHVNSNIWRTWHNVFDEYVDGGSELSKVIQ
jgi:prepilin-type N-terminal cleavage/methylation domain-containing protein